ncbi:MAG: DUF1211 domain-containing protein [Proteobacteria bacterium]|nr:DUF1211 domain-containing protein [Pseudomonadota bacterium]MBS0464441.1 DUF1211 domain-containing protein [Pseudomonadota bacterium]
MGPSAESSFAAASAERGDKTTRLEAFVDAAFAFAVTLLVIAGDHLPRSVDDLILALKSVPTFAASFMLILTFWTAHTQWSRCYGLDDAPTRRLSLLLVFLVLIFVYPLRMVFGSLFALLSSGWLPANFGLRDWRDIPALFVTYGLAYGALCAVVWRLYLHAWRCRDELALTSQERIATRVSVLRWALLCLVAAVSVAIAWALLKFADESWRWQLGLPGYLYFGNLVIAVSLRRYERRLHASQASA